MKILVVDDVKGWREYHKNILSEMFLNSTIDTAESARVAYDKLLENNDNPYNIIIADMQMETDFEPKYAGEWLIEQIKTFKKYSKTKILIISAAYNIEHIAKNYDVNFIRKSTALNFPSAYSILL